jgi:3-oxoacyl-[acyl-carrier-protein] synthase-1
VLVVGLETFNPLAFWGLEGFGILSPGNSFRPFDKDRSGFILGEGCGALILDTEAGAANDLQFLSSASLCDTHNLAGNEPGGSIMEMVMKKAIQEAGLDVRDIAVIKAHGAASPGSDLAELIALKKVFGNKVPPFTSIKPFLGHALGASGIIELIVMTEALKRGFVPKTPNYAHPESGMDIEPITEDLAIREGHMLLNCFGFGGGCTSTVVSTKKA